MSTMLQSRAVVLLLVHLSIQGSLVIYCSYVAHSDTVLRGHRMPVEGVK